MGEKETMAGTNAATRSGTLNVSATPGGSQGASLMGETPAGGNLSADPAGDGGNDERKGPNAVNVKLA